MRHARILATLTLASIASGSFACANKPIHTQGRAMQTKSGHADVNGISYYYEIRGRGEPLLLLHGGLGSIDMFAPILPVPSSLS
jgi:hypothetical protein